MFKSSFRKRVAFTLSEVLITLGIIGVVAAITIPMLMTKYQKTVTLMRLKETYTIFQQAVKLSEDENGDVSGWDLRSGDWFGKYIRNYMKVAKSELKNSTAMSSIVYKQTSGARESGLGILRGLWGGTYVYTLLNGADFLVSFSDNPGIIVDTNGINTPPNQFGKDAFYFHIKEEAGFVPLGSRSTSECKPPVEGNPGRDYLLDNNCLSYACNKKSRGMWCAALIMADGWTFGPDYPW